MANETETRPRTRRGLPPPDLRYIQELKTELQQLYADQDTQITEMREVRELKRAVPIDKDLRIADIEIRDPTATDEIQRVAATFSVNPFRITVKTPATVTSDKRQANATKREHFSEEVLRVAGQRAPGLDTFRRSCDACPGDGAAWTKFLYSRDYWDERYRIRLRDEEANYEVERSAWQAKASKWDEEHPEAGDDERGGRPQEPESADSRFNRKTEAAKKRAGPPFAWLFCDPLTIYPVWTAGTLTQVLEVQERPRLATFRQYQLREDKDGNVVPDELGQGAAEGQSAGGVASKVLYVELWDKEWATVAVLPSTGGGAGRIVKQWRHGYGQVPYFWAPGLWFSYWSNRKVGWSIAQAKRFLVEYRSFLWTLHAQVAARDTFAPLQEVQESDVAASIIGDAGTPKAAEQPQKPVKWGLREIVKPGQGRHLEAIKFPEVASALKEQIALVSEAIDKLDTPRVAGNIGSGLEGAGFAINQILAEIKVRNNPLMVGLEQMIRDVVRFLWHLIRVKVKERVWVYSESSDAGWLSAGPEDLEDDVTLRVELDPERPSDKLIQVRVEHERLQAGTTFEDAAIERLGDNPDEVRQGKALQRMRATPWYTKMQDQYVLDELALGDMLKEAEAVAATGVLPGMPPGTAVQPAMGSQGIPDMGALAMAPGGAGAMGMAPAGGAVSGVGPGAVVPQASAAPTAALVG